jgi:hypothetical protein
MVRRLLEYRGYVQTWLWIWGFVSAVAVAVVVWALVSRLPPVTVAVLGLATAVLTLIGLETAIRVYQRIEDVLAARHRRAVAALADLETKGMVLRDRMVASAADVDTFAFDFVGLEAEAITAMKGVATPTEISWFRDLHQWTVPNGFVAYDDEHARLKATLAEKLRRMHQIAAKLEAKIR